MYEKNVKEINVPNTYDEYFVAVTNRSNVACSAVIVQTIYNLTVY